MKLRHLPAAMLAAILVVAVTACGDDGDTAAQATTASPPTTTQQATTTMAPMDDAADTQDDNADDGEGAGTTLPVDVPGDETTAAAAAIVLEISVADDGSVSGPDRPQVDLGDVVRIVVSGPVTDEVHVHGYDVMADITPEAPAEIELTADTPGIFEVELEDAHTLLMELRVG